MGMSGGNASVVADAIGSTPNPAMGPTPPIKPGCVEAEYESSTSPEMDYALTRFGYSVLVSLQNASDNQTQLASICINLPRLYY